MPHHVAMFSMGFLALAAGALCLGFGLGHIARRFGLGSFGIGLTVVPFAAALPVTAVALTAASHQRHMFTLGLISGSNVVNVAFALGCAAMLRPLFGTSRTVAAMIAASLVGVLLFWFVCRDCDISRVDGCLLLLGLAASVMYVRREATEETDEVMSRFDAWNFRPQPPWRVGLSVLIGAGLLGVGAMLLVPEAAEIANKQLKINTRLFAITAVSLACTPALLCVLETAARNYHADLVFGTVAGVNLCNVLLTPGVVALVTPLGVTDRAVMNDIPATALVSFLLLIPFLNGLRLSRPEGGLLLTVYALFVWWQVR